MRRGLLFLSLSLLLLSTVAVSFSSGPGWALAQEEGEARMSKEDSAQINLHRPPEAFFAGARMTAPVAFLLRSARKAGWSGRVSGPSSGARTHSEQGRLHDLFLRGQGAPAFPPGGPSRHQINNIKEAGGWSQAVDVSRPGELLEAAASLGVALRQPYADEPWHVEAQGPFALPPLPVSPASSGRPAAPQVSSATFPVAVLLLAALPLLILFLAGDRSARGLALLWLGSGVTVLLLNPIAALACLSVLLIFGALLLSPLALRSWQRSRSFYVSPPKGASQNTSTEWLGDISWSWPR